MQATRHFTEELFELKDEAYKEFNKKLVPNVSEDTMIGIRTPKLRELAKKLWKEDRASCLAFMKKLPHAYFEENNLHAFFIEQIKDLGEAIDETETFLPYIDNWETCDLFSPKLFKTHKAELLKHIEKWMQSKHTYTVRYAIGLLLQHFLDEDFKADYLEQVAKIHSEEYYIRMMVAWYFSIALVKQYEETLPFLQEQKLESWTHNKAIQKARESTRMSPEKKAYLNTLKVK
ncbi:MAG: DNA alkylation repair protein [Bacillota bacterium]|nr:DNA alkylation repair protein [Bacillota bacterium]